MTVTYDSGLYMIESMVTKSSNVYLDWRSFGALLYRSIQVLLTNSPLYTYHTDSQNSVIFLRILHHYHVTDQEIIQSNYNSTL